MPSAEERQAKALEGIEFVMRRKVAKACEAIVTLNEHVAKLVGQLQELLDEDNVDLDELAENVEKLKALKLPQGDITELKYIKDSEGRLKPYEWRHNLGMDKVVNDPMGRENEQMTEEQFRLYNSALRDFNRGVFYSDTSKKDDKNKFVPDELGQLYPSEWRYNLGCNKIIVVNPEDRNLTIYENQKMTKEKFEYYNAGLYNSGTIEDES